MQGVGCLRRTDGKSMWDSLKHGQSPNNSHVHIVLSTLHDNCFYRLLGVQCLFDPPQAPLVKETVECCGHVIF